MSNNVINRMEPINFEFLNGFRGLCALWVVWVHSGFSDLTKNISSNDFISFICLTGQTFSVNGFFILSSFLLTHRLLADSTKYSIILNLAMYFIRRLLRIYLVYVIFCSLIKFGPKFLGGIYNNDPDYYSSWFELITLTSIGRNHLWTIPPEIFFYFILPIIPLVHSLLSRKLKLLWVIQLLTVVHLNLFVNIFKLPSGSKNFQNSIHYSFMLSLPVFIQGSTLSLFFQYFNENLSQALNTFLNWHKFLQILYKPLLNISTLILISLAFESSVYNQQHRTDKSDFNYLIKPAYLWTVVLFVMLISKENENIFKELLENQILKSFGKYSFGIYLWHPMCIYFESNYNNIMRSHMNRYIYIVFISFTAGFFFFHTVEKNLIGLANHLCSLLKINLKSFYQKDNIIIINKTNG